jgi:SAM-dependent methyltransferase
MALDGDDAAQEVRRGDDLGEGQRVALGHEPIGFAPDHTVQEQPPWCPLVADHVTHADLVDDGGGHHRHVTVEDEGDHAPAAGLDLQATALPQELPGDLRPALHSRHDRIEVRKCRRFLSDAGYDPGMRGWRVAPYMCLWAAARMLELAGRGAMYVSAGLLRLHDLHGAIARTWAKFGRNEDAILSGFMSWEEALYGRFLKPDDDILLIGCGTGRDLIALLRRGHRVTGLDPAPGALDLARQMLARERLTAELHAVSIETAPLPGCFDAFIFSWYCYSYIPQADSRIAVLRKLKANLNPGGRILISYLPVVEPPHRLPIRLTQLVAHLTRSDWHPELGDVLGPATGDPGAVRYEHCFTRAEFEIEARAAGLSVLFHQVTDDGTAVLTA